MRILNFDEMKREKGVPFSRAHVWRLEKAGKFPRRVRLGEVRHGWIDAEIDEWIASRIAARDGVA